MRQVLSEDAKAEWEASSITPATCGQGAARVGFRVAPVAVRSLVTFPCLSAVGSEHSTPQKKRRFLTLESKDTLEPRNQRIAENGNLFTLGRSEPEVADAVLAAIMADEEVTDATLADFTADEEVMAALRDRLGDQPAQVEPETASLMTTHVISHEQVQLEAIDYSKQVTTDHGQVRMTPEQKALYIARQRMQISRTDTEMYQVVHTLALALGAIRTEAGTHKALFAALVLLNRPDMTEQEVCASTGTSIASCKKWRRKVLNAQAGLPLTSANASVAS